MRANYLPLLTISRFIAALIVLISHYMQFGLIPMNESFIELFHGGGVAVTYFFVLSGFILSHNYRSFSANGSTQIFFLVRFARIYPMLFASVIFSVLILRWIPNGVDENRTQFVPTSISHTILASLGQLTGLGTWLPFSAVQAVLNAPAWSVGCEVFFYLTFPYLIGGLSGKYSLKRVGLFFIIYLFSISILAIYIFQNDSNRSQLLLGRFPALHLFEFIAGLLAYKFMLHGRISKYRFRFFFLSSLLCTLTLIFVRGSYSFLLLGPIFAVLVAALALETPRHHNGIVSKSLILLGESSYCLYLIHFPVGILLISSANRDLMAPISLGLVIVISIFLHLFYEVPSRKWIIGKFITGERF